MRAVLAITFVCACGRHSFERQDGGDVDAAPDARSMVVAELSDDTAGDELYDDWLFDQLQGVTLFPGSTRWTFTCSGGGSTGGMWTVDVPKGSADDCIATISPGPSTDYPVTQVSGTSILIDPFLRCGESKEASLRGTGFEAWTMYPPATDSREGQWCTNEVSSGTNPTSSHNLTIIAN